MLVIFSPHYFPHIFIMKSIRILVPIIAVIAIGAFVFTAESGSKNELNLLIWDNYLADDTISNFEKETESRVIVELFKSNEELLAKIKTNPGVYDVIVPSDYMIAIMSDEGLLEPLDHTMLPNEKNIAQTSRKPYYDPELTYTVPYAYGSAGFAVNTAHVSDKTITWKTLTEPRFKGQVVLMDDMRYVLGSVLLELGLDPNTRKQADIDAAVALLKQVLPNVSKITPDTPVDLMAANGAWVAYGYSGDSYQMHDMNPDITYMLPTYGGLQFADNLAIPKGAPHKELAQSFLNYILRPEVAAAITEATSYATPNTAAFDLVDEAVRQNPSVYPPKSAMSKLHFVEDLGDDIALYDNAWQEIKR